MENIKENQNVKELTDEQLKEVSGGTGERGRLEGKCPEILGCKNQYIGELCECAECEEGFVLVSGVCKISPYVGPSAEMAVN